MINAVLVIAAKAAANALPAANVKVVDNVPTVHHAKNAASAHGAEDVALVETA